MVGDGINDAAAMAHADVSIALGSATDLARATADIVLLNDDLCDLVFAMEVAQESLRVIAQNKTIVVAPNVAAIAYGAVAVLNPIAGVVINNGVGAGGRTEQPASPDMFPGAYPNSRQRCQPQQLIGSTQR